MVLSLTLTEPVGVRSGLRAKVDHVVWIDNLHPFIRI